MLRVSELYADEDTVFDNFKSSILFNLRCCIPGIVQSYNPSNNTIEVQPAIRERIIQEDGKIVYMQLPLLINVPVAFPRTADYGISFPIKKNDEVLVLFADNAIDNFWEKGSVQNPVESRRHDLSDGIAIPCTLSVPKATPAPNSSIVITSKGCSIEVGDSDIIFSAPSMSMAFSTIYSHIMGGGLE